LSEQRKQLEVIAAAQAERETALHKAEKALKQAADAQRKRTRVRNIAFGVVSIFAVLAAWLGWRATQELTTADKLLEDATNIVAKLQHQMDIDTKKKAFAVYQRGAYRGDMSSMRNLAGSYQDGFGVAQDYAKARGWFERAADRGDADAMTSLGALYANGQGGAQDYAKARGWFEKAAANGDTNAMLDLGLLYANGRGVAQDYAKAREWYEKAAESSSHSLYIRRYRCSAV
jgi:TPR repeat protein